MDAEGLSRSRRAFLAGVGGSVLSAVARAQANTTDSGPPPLRTARSQFVELRPLNEVPTLVLERIDGKLVALNSLRGKAILVNFWATWCPPCRRELPLLDGLQRRAGETELEIVAVSIDQAGHPVVASFLKQLNVTRLRPFLDPLGRIARRAESEAPTPFVLWGMPISYIIDRRGRLAGYITGEVDWLSDQGRTFLNFFAAG
ncbi:MAG: TlpA family protein disulfide reductase [Bradyrhizobium sp.]|uniref:TlpA disulfide reductase family protein n=1 Tax=Bradyrhizobium sp. TaxID=376 RepID=UPI0025BF2E47|nr:TlpA disulfide reductase family protein [Bradyrhizobium sp.]MBI5263485.1 TlpA family protein disulfide reductase [Bradyrhizobium sp.]